MKQVLFIGDYEKTDLMFYISKLISIDHKVLLVDATQYGRYKYVYPKIDQMNFNQHENIDIIENIVDVVELKHHLENKNYDFVLVDIDNPNALQKWPAADEYFMVTSYEKPVLQHNLTLMECFFHEKSISELIPISRIIYETGDSPGIEFINDLFDKYPIDWKEAYVYYPDERDMIQKIKNQYSSKIQLKGLSPEYKKVLKQISAEILNLKFSEVKLLWKQAERSK